jgi:hypothetical protein
MNDITYVGLDVHKTTVCVAIAESGRGGEVREVGVFENRPDVLRKMVARLGKHRRRLNFCYEAGPCGYGLHRLLTGLGHECVVVATTDEEPRALAELIARFERNTAKHTTRHAGYAVSQRIRKRIEEAFGWIKMVGTTPTPRLPIQRRGSIAKGLAKRPSSASWGML